MRRFRIADGRLRIPAFAGMTSICKGGSHYDGRSAEGVGAAKHNESIIILRHYGIVKDNTHRIALRHSRERACEKIERRYYSSSFPRILFVIPAKAGICLRRFRIADGRLRIPAFAGMTSICKGGSHYDGRSAEGVGAAKHNESIIILRHYGIVKDNTHRIALRHSRERACEKIERRYYSSSFPRILFVIPAKAGIRRRTSAISARFFLRKRRKEIPAFAGMTSVCFAGMTSVCKAVRFLHMLFRGMTRYYSMGIVFTMPAPRRSVRHDERRAIPSRARPPEAGKKRAARRSAQP